MRQVPEMWARLAYPSQLPLYAWLADFAVRVGHMQQWMCNGPPAAYWLPAFFFPQARRPTSRLLVQFLQSVLAAYATWGAHVQGFLTAVLQAYARKHSIPLDTAWLTYKVTSYCTGDALPGPPADGVFVDGLTIDAGRWDMADCCLAEPLPGVLASALPVLHILPTHKDTPAAYHGACYACPLYKTAARVASASATGQSTSVVATVDLPVRSGMHADTCVLHGVALILCHTGDVEAQ